MKEQQFFMKRVCAVTHMFDHVPLAYTHSYGCQQNVSDGEKINGMLYRMGYDITDDPEKADFILYNTCAVRENAEISCASYIFLRLWNIRNNLHRN